MIVGFDERRDAWMDEGFTTFIDVYESDAFQNGIYGPKRDSEYAPGGGNPVDEILPVLADPRAPVPLTRADAIEEEYRHPITYFKSLWAWCCCANKCSERSVSIGPSASSSATGRFAIPRRRISFEPWKARAVRTCRGSARLVHE